MSTLRLRALALSLCFFAPWAGAVDYRSVGVPAAILYDAPSLQAKKLYLIKAQTPAARETSETRAFSAEVDAGSAQKML